MLYREILALCKQPYHNEQFLNIKHGDTDQLHLMGSHRTWPMAIFTRDSFGQIHHAMFLRDKLFFGLDCDPVKGEGHVHAELSVDYF